MPLSSAEIRRVLALQGPYPAYVVKVAAGGLPVRDLPPPSPSEEDVVTGRDDLVERMETDPVGTTKPFVDAGWRER
jgi:hypothetical protein